MEMFLLFWESWPVFVTGLVTLGVTVYAFLPSQKSPTAGMIYQVVTVMSFILALPAVLININRLLELEWFQITDDRVLVAILWLNLLGGLVALLSCLLSILGVGQMNLPPARQQFANAASGNQHQIPTPPSSHSIRQPTPQSVRFSASTGPLTDEVTSHVRLDFTDDEVTSRTDENPSDNASSTSINSYQVSTLDDVPSRPSPTPVRPVTHIKENDKSDETILLGAGSQAAKSSLFAWLVALNGADRGQAYALTEYRNIIGRASKCKIILTDKAVSAQHA